MMTARAAALEAEETQGRARPSRASARADKVLVKIKRWRIQSGHLINPAK